MDKYTLGEVAYKNGYEKGFQDGVKSLEAEIEELKEKRIEDDKLLNDRVDEAVNAVIKAHLRYENALEEHLKTAKIEACKEFADKVNENRLTYFNYIYSDDGFANITNNIYKELTEKKEDGGNERQGNTKKGKS